MSAEDQDRDEQARRYLSMEDVAEDVDLPEPPPARPVEHRRNTGAGKAPLVAGVVAVLAIAGAGVARAALARGDHDAAPKPTTTSVTAPPSPIGAPPTSSPASSSSTTTRPSATSSVLPATTRAQRATSTAEKFVRALVNTARPQAQWQHDATAFGTQTLAHDLAVTDPRDIPAQHITGHGKVAATSTEEPVITVFVPTSSHGYTVMLLSNDGGRTWLVDQATPGQPHTSTPVDPE